MEAKRGRAIIEQIIRTLDPSGRQPMNPETLAEIEASTVPDSLRAWLAFDTKSPNGDVSLVDGEGELAFREAVDLFEELVASESEGEDWEEDTREAMRELALTVPGDLLLLRAPSDEDHFLYLGKRGPRGEYPVLVLEDEELRVGWSGFDTYVGELTGVLTPSSPEEVAARAVMTKLLFG